MMYLIVPIVVFVGVIWALVVFPSFRVVAVILVALGTVAYFVMSDKAAQEQKEQAAQKEKERIAFEAKQNDYCKAEQKRWTIVSGSQIELRNASLTQGQFYSTINDDFTFTASVKNKSKSKVTKLRLNITALDCPTQDARANDCDIVGRSDETFDADIPAGEVRQINGKITLRDVPKPRGVFSPRFAVNGVRTPIDAADTEADDLLGIWLYKCN